MAIHFSEEDQKKLNQDTSEIYQKRTRKTTEEDVKNLSAVGKWQHFKDYYLKAVLIGILILVLVGIQVFDMMKGKPDHALYVAVQDDVFEDETIAALEDTLEKYYDLNPEQEIVRVSVDGDVSQIQTYLYTGTIDVLIASEEQFQKWAESGYFFDTKRNSEVEFYENYDEKYQFRTKYISGEDVRESEDRSNIQASDTTEYYCGVYLTDSEKYRQIGGYLEKPVAGIANATKHSERAKEFVEYMMDNSIPMNLKINAK